MEVRGHPMLRRPPPMTTPPKQQNARKYYEFHKQSRHTTTECRELKKALHELADKGQIDRFFKRGPWFLQQEQEPTKPQLRDGERSTEVVATITGAYAEGLTRSAWKAQLKRPYITVPTMVIVEGKPRNLPLHKMKIASAIVWRILIDMGSSVNIITWDCLKKLTHPGHDIIPLVHPILGFGRQEVNPTGMIRLLVCFGDKLKSKNLKVYFLVIDVPTAYNMILGRPTLHKKRKKKRRGRKKKEQGKRGGLHIRLSTILMTLILRSLGLSIQGVSGLIPCTLTLTGRRNKFHLLKVSAFVAGPLALIYVIEHRWHRVTSPLSLRHSAATLTPPPSERFGHCHLLLGDLGESKVPEAAKFQDLTKPWTSENLAAGFVLMNLWLAAVRLGENRQRHNLRGHQFILVQNLFTNRVKRKSETLVESRVINNYTFGGWLIYCGIHLGDCEGVPGRQEERPWGQKSDYLDRPEGLSGLRPLQTLVPPPQSQELVLQANDLFY
ncbi:hypothetical protein Cgig2_011323 [Carnegiea gigantea]|uniref:Reverse transcriptase domain-containing protein n=1 Tax=Carnegiea gigantea TaxID=171969 RepID=A0A9Q1KF11_9CARY|nr:hypothetical protein Cgig2_011323 [Carnegiea gigantea]